MKKITKIALTFGITTTLLLGFQSILAKGKPQSGGQQPPQVVSITTAKNTPWQESLDATGSLAALNGIIVKSETSGRVTKIYFKSGQFIQQGAPLVQIYPDIIRAQLEQAKAQLTLNQLNYQRSVQLYQKHYVAKSDLDKTAADLKNSQGAVNSLEAQLSQTLITAPFSGQLGLRQISLGDFLNVGANIVDLEALSPIRVDFSVPQTYLGKIQVGQTVKIHANAFADENFAGKIYAINSSVDTSTRSLNVRASVPNTQYKLLPGTFVEVTLFFGQPQTVLVVPQTAIVYSETEDDVYKVVNSKAVKTKVTLGDKLQEGNVIIKSGLNVNDPVVSNGQMKIDDGDTVMSPEQAAQVSASQQKG